VPELVKVLVVVPVGADVLPVPLSVQLNVYVVPLTPPLNVLVNTPPGHISVGAIEIVGSAVNTTVWLALAAHPLVDDVLVFTV
jgi:hypothetical protein